MILEQEWIKKIKNTDSINLLGGTKMITVGETWSSQLDMLKNTSWSLFHLLKNKFQIDVTSTINMNSNIVKNVFDWRVGKDL